MRSIHSPKACITDKVCITHVVHIVFPRERITQKNLICQINKSGFFVGGPEGDRTLEPHGCEPCALPAELRAHINLISIAHCFIKIQSHFNFFRNFLRQKAGSSLHSPPKPIYSLLIASINAGINCFLRETTPGSVTVPSTGCSAKASRISDAADSP